MVLGAAVGLAGGPAAADKVGWLGTVFVQLLKMVIVPLVFFSVATGVASVGTGRDLGRLGLKTLAYYVTTSLAAIFVGQLLVNAIRPGVGASFEGLASKTVPQVAQPAGAGQFALDLLLRFIPKNPIEAFAGGEMLGIIGFAIFVGVAISHSPIQVRDRAKTAFDAAFEVMMTLTGFAIKVLPLGVFGLIAVAATSADAATVRALVKYVVTIALGLAIHAGVTLPLLLIVLGRVSPRAHARAMRDALLTAFSTSSSAATMPVTLDGVERRAGVSKRVANFVIPVGATVNMDGTALYECVGVIFIAQALGFDLSAAQQATIVVTALAASIGAAGIPSAGLVMIFIVLEAVGLAGEAATVIVGVMLAIDRPLDMMRTAVNIWSDSCGAVIVARSEGEELPALARPRPAVR
ncbi:MAG: dicarboxylate/amino acid:cation symporter [Deltaproteobacteria bacterium]|nr:MAG: dicarboxylate/amino acid:cation symporter [Deltaproteobacteria bacterium]